MVNRALDSLAAGGLGSGRTPSAEEIGVDAATQYDALTWKSIVDQPVVSDVDSIHSHELYPPGAPPLAGDAGAGSGARVDESSDHLDLSGFPGVAGVDPFTLVGPDLRGINASIKALLGVDHPVLDTVAKYFFDWDGGKKIRPALVLLMAHAVNHHMAGVAAARSRADGSAAAAGGGGGGGAAGAAAGSAAPVGAYTPNGKFTLTEAEVSAARELAESGVATLARESERRALPAQVVLPLQRRLAEITELIHTASLLHDDVIDAADTRRGVGSVNAVFGNKLAVLAGDFLLARASLCLARLRNVPVVELLSTVIEHLVKGEVMQMRQTLRNEGASRAAFEAYLRKSYYKTGSLMANSCKAIAVLGCYPDEVATAAYKYGLHLGIAFQLVDDMLDFEGTAASLGKPALNDIKCGLSTAPVLYAAAKFPSLLPLIDRKFEAPGDVDTAVRTIQAADGIALTRKLAVVHGQLALDALGTLADSPSRTALAAMVPRVLNRNR